MPMRKKGANQPKLKLKLTEGMPSLPKTDELDSLAALIRSINEKGKEAKAKVKAKDESWNPEPEPPPLAA